jgi:hemin uptake protein HemP
VTLVSPQPPLRITAEVQSPADERTARGPAIPLIRSNDLFGKGREILIEHDGSYYRLRLTQSNKLILTK